MTAYSTSFGKYEHHLKSAAINKIQQASKDMGEASSRFILVSSLLLALHEGEMNARIRSLVQRSPAVDSCNEDDVILITDNCVACNPQPHTCVQFRYFILVWFYLESAAISKICNHRVSSLCQIIVLLAIEQCHIPYACNLTAQQLANCQQCFSGE